MKNKILFIVFLLLFTLTICTYSQSKESLIGPTWLQVEPVPTYDVMVKFFGSGIAIVYKKSFDDSNNTIERYHFKYEGKYLTIGDIGYTYEFDNHLLVLTPAVSGIAKRVFVSTSLPILSYSDDGGL
jgi:hypothetical protein